MRDVTALNVKVFRWIVFLLASGFWLSQFTTSLAEGFGLQFRFLTVWGLTVYVVIAAMKATTPFYLLALFWRR